MDILEKELAKRKDAIKSEVALLFKANMKFTDWDIPEVDDEKASKMILEIFRESLEEISCDIDAGKYKNY